MVGLICLDIINFCDRYPKEDEDIRAIDQKWSQGGNATNTSLVLTLLGRECELLATVGAGMETEFTLAALDRLGISHGNCVHHSHCRLPTSYVVINRGTGSRTIVHYRNLPELSAADFIKLDISKYGWIHFEGRQPDQYRAMMEQVATYNASQTKSSSRVKISVELEKKRLSTSELVLFADVVMMSKEYAISNGYQSAEEAVVGLRAKVKPGAIVTCTWGDRGAAASDQEEKVWSCPAIPSPRVIDTLGAGDTFNAGVIHSLYKGCSTEQALKFACELAGAKCGMEGFDGLKEFGEHLHVNH
eukprot:Em0020g975a